MAFGVGGEVDVLSEVKTVEEREEVRCQGGVGLVYVNVQVTGEEEAGGKRRCNGEEFREFGQKRGVGLGGTVKKKSSDGFGK